MAHDLPGTLTRRELLESVGKMAAVSLVATPIVSALGSGLEVSAQALPMTAVAGVDRVVMLHGRTYLHAWGGYGAPPGTARPARGTPPPPAPDPAWPVPTLAWRKVSGPGDVSFADATSATTTATFAAPGTYVLGVTAGNGTLTAESTLTVTVELPPPATPLTPVITTSHTITSPLWAARTKALIVNWIPHCVD
jgi:hypothetical protein